MKKLILSILALMAICIGFQACSDTKTYAEMMEEEDDAIRDFIKANDITVISQSEFYAQDSMTGNNEYVQLTSGVYMNIVDKGSSSPSDTVKNNDLILVRFMEYDILAEDTTLSNIADPGNVDEFKYTKTSTSIAGIFTQGYMYNYYGSSVPAGWLVPLDYVRSGAHVKLIVPHKMGHSTALSNVYPYFYDIQKYQIWK